ncbi:Ldh family oxidoreductase [Plantactinospora sp. BB1]|uniref:Ldh family oxidoreductase n=1 Tax=Plantactinospora sp. BB1 TaxID=2071627 RepID=UPI000D168B9A|nr:Ldh family oxidoreductase [Plantactinospora sp. BB1]AVT39665.1 dehydrogenase [Plantactinospora sp. BB1]
MAHGEDRDQTGDRATAHRSPSWSTVPTSRAPDQPAAGADDGVTPVAVAADELVEIAARILVTAGSPEPAARAVAVSLVESDLVGHDSHGVRRLVPYVDAVRGGMIDPSADPVVRRRHRATAVVDGRRGFGQLAARLAVTEARDLAREYGVGVVTIGNCNHIGRLGEYVQTLAETDAVGLAFCNIDPTVAPYGGRERRLGTNPLAWSAPRADGRPPVVVDFATSAIAEGKLALSLARQERVGTGLLVDAEGRDSTDPADFYTGGALLPFGQHKGYGLSVMIEIVGGLLSGAGVSSLPGYDNTNGTVLIAIDIETFVPVSGFRSRSEEFCRLLGDTAPAVDTDPGPDGVLVPGEKEARTRAARISEGITLAPSTWRELAELPGGPELPGVPVPVPHPRNRADGAAPSPEENPDDTGGPRAPA